MIKWVETEYPDYYQESVVELTDEQKADRKRYYTSTHDFLYGNLNVNVTKAFLATKKYHKNKLTRDGKPVHYSFSHLRKFYDAILFGSYRARVPLLIEFEMEMKAYIDSMK